MKKAGLLKETQRHKILETSGANLISVDVQPEYQDYFGWDAFSYGKMINSGYEHLNSLTFLFNGPDLGFLSEQEYQWWLIEECGIHEDIINTSNFFDKGYAFFRYCMDENVDEDELVRFIQFMITKNITDSRDIDAEMWTTYMRDTGADESEVRDLLEPAEDMINIPDLMDFLKTYAGKLMLCGGGIQECLKEVEIALLALQKPYNIYTDFTY